MPAPRPSPVIALLVLAPLSLLAADADLDFIGKLPGLSATVTEASKTVYVSMGASPSLMDDVKKGLTERGWECKTTVASAGGAATSALVATRESRRVTISIAQVGGVATLTVETSSSGTTPPTGASGSRAAAAATPASGSGKAAGASLVLADNDVTETYECQDTRVVINGNDCRITLKGRCASLVVNGDDNSVNAGAAVASIVANGDDNKVTWSAGANPSAPKVVSNGNRNEIVKGP